MTWLIPKNKIKVINNMDTKQKQLIIELNIQAKLLEALKKKKMKELAKKVKK